jgi:hypothetical protein
MSDLEPRQNVRRETWRSLQRRAVPYLAPRLDQLRQDSLERHVAVLEGYLMHCLRDSQTATEFLNRLPDIYGSCNQDIYERPMVAEAYAYIHMISRYCNWWDTFAELFNAGRLPMRESGLRALDVGAGPGPATYALLDFSQALNQAAVDFDNIGEFNGLVAPRPDVVMVESSKAMSHFVHRLSEERGLGGPFGAGLYDFFGLRLVRTREMNASLRESLISKIMDDWDVGSAGAEWVLREEYAGWHEPERYHLCMISHFLTREEVLSHAAEALAGVKRTLPPGGTIAVVGSAGHGATYGPIYKELGRQMRGLHHLGISGTYRSDIDERSQVRINAFYLNIRQRISDLGINISEVMACWPPGIEKLVAQRWRPDNKTVLPPFTVEVFRAEHSRMGNQSRRRQRLGIRTRRSSQEMPS